MKTSIITPRQKQLLQIIYDWLKAEGNIPSFEEMKNELGVNSNQAVLDLLGKLEEKKMIKRNEGLARSINILQKGFEALGTKSIIKIEGRAPCGTLMEIFEQQDVWMELSAEVHEFSDKLKIIKAFGDSMIGADIHDGDMLLVEKRNEFKDGDIVFAHTMEGFTVKRLRFKDKKIYFQPENTKYDIIPVCEDTLIKGKIIKNLSR